MINGEEDQEEGQEEEVRLFSLKWEPSVVPIFPGL
jgi:hypothetical protein